MTCTDMYVLVNSWMTTLKTNDDDDDDDDDTTKNVSDIYKNVGV